ncbi:MAG TPA: LytTR family DNA-binding domain-containing protein [Gemmatimonadaceae bacterium]|nr:LytTR family DNA-binding domain-containing protein [Gemmatimonadaceae bacterium]
MIDARVRALVVDDEPLARGHLRALLEDRGDVQVVDECGDGRTAVERIRELGPDLVLLDVQMPELDGLGVVRAIGPDRMPLVVFVTAHDQHAVEAFEVHALDYVLKPFHRARFNSAIDRVVSLIRSGSAHSRSRPLAEAVDRLAAPASERIAIRSGDRVLYLRTADIDWIEAADDLVRLHVGKQVYDHRATMSQIEQRLPASRFLRIHRSTIVNVERIREFQPWFQGDWILVLADGTRLQSGKSYRKRIRELMDS